MGVKKAVLHQQRDPKRAISLKPGKSQQGIQSVLKKTEEIGQLDKKRSDKTKKQMDRVAVNNPFLRREIRR